jgi:RNA polymerase sigma-70 factor (ECF subfamily)
MEPSDRDSEHLRRIEAALLELPDMDRQILLAARLDRMSVREIARETGLSRKQVEIRLGRAILLVTCRMGERP